MARRAQGSVYRKSTRRNGRTVKAGFYRAKYRDACGELCDHVLVLANGQRVTDKTVAESELAKILKRVERKAAGLVDPVVQNAALPIRVVLGQFIGHLRRKGVGRQYLRQALGYNKWLIEHAPMERFADFREDRIDKALAMLADKGLSPRTVNAYREVALAMGQWALAVARIIDRNPVAAIRKRDQAVDTRKVRRALTVDEAYRLLRVSGPRRLFYAVQIWTGLRVGEATALEWRDLDLDGARPCIRLRAATTKAGRADVLPLHPDLVELLRSAKPAFAQPTASIFRGAPTLGTFKGKWYGKGEERRHVRGDLDRAGIAFADDRDRTVDRHALRTTFIS